MTSSQVGSTRFQHHTHDGYTGLPRSIRSSAFPSSVKMGSTQSDGGSSGRPLGPPPKHDGPSNVFDLTRRRAWRPQHFHRRPKSERVGEQDKAVTVKREGCCWATVILLWRSRGQRLVPPVEAEIQDPRGPRLSLIEQSQSDFLWQTPHPRQECHL